MNTKIPKLFALATQAEESQMRIDAGSRLFLGLIANNEISKDGLDTALALSALLEKAGRENKSLVDELYNMARAAHAAA